MCVGISVVLAGCVIYNIGFFLYLRSAMGDERDDAVYLDLE